MLRRVPTIQLAGLLVAVAAIALVPSRPSMAAPPAASATTAAIPQSNEARPPGGKRGPLGAADGALRNGTTIFDDDRPGIANLEADLVRALRQAASAAAEDGVAILIESGWRSEAYQEQLFRDAVAQYGSTEEAARWVAPPSVSAHVSGEAVDVGPTVAMAWLTRQGAGYGLCQIYRNEPWHFELRPRAIEAGCPAMYADATRSVRTR